MTQQDWPAWNGELHLPWLKSGLLALGLHPWAGMRWLPGEALLGTELGAWMESGRWHPGAYFCTVWLGLVALAPWKSLRTDLTDPSLRP